jgi:hypothetical protein
MNKLALLVGVGKYLSDQWPELPKPSDNIGIMKDILLRFNFKDKDILSLSSEDQNLLPKAKNIVDHFQDHLIARAKRGDVAVFYYFGHGTRVPSTDDDEKEDGCDEAIVPYDADVKEWKNYILDDDLWYLIQQLTGNGVQTTVIMESCHSGTSVRALGFLPKPRPCGGGDTAPIPVAPYLQGAPRIRRNEKMTGSKWMPEGNYVLLAACADEQLNWIYGPGGDVGRLTWCLSQELSAEKIESSGVPTYRRLHENIRHRFTEISNGPVQNPQLEGSPGARDWLVFGGEPQPAARYILVTEWSGGKINLSAGVIHGLSKGSKLDIFPGQVIQRKDARDIDRLAEAEVEDVKAGWSRAHLSNPVSKELEAKLLGAHAFVRTLGCSEFCLPVSINDSVPDRIKIAAALEESALLQVVDKSRQAEVDYSREKGMYHLLLDDGDVGLPGAGKKEEPHETIRRVLEQIARRHNLLDKLEILKPKESLLEGKVILGLSKLDRDGKVVEALGRESILAPGDHIQLDVINRSGFALFCSVFGCSPLPYYEIRLLYPAAEGAIDNKLKSQDLPHTIGQFEITEVEGPTIIKLIATQKFSDLSSWTQARLPDGEVVRLRALGDFPGLFTSLWCGAPVGTVIQLAQGEDWTTDSMSFSVQRMQAEHDGG